MDPKVPVGSTGAQLHALCRSKWLVMALNEPKMPQNVPKIPQNDAPRAEKGCLKGTWKAKFALKRVPRDPFQSNLVRF